ncbi:arylesterase [Allomuricauda sp. SCSIO 65647]|uniref:arylesterase n=1 Tax=Allomuricauda sp. SCSIO 65647 TaxID=2908843 RepID=UPI001F283588|nr:arylesterase [Muricauda sp. SCSIO 65647]UJH67751.1 arylesterase [Muricauda sp. SCSIO 65647]
MNPKTLLKFRYFLLFIFLLACKDAPKNESEATTAQETEETSNANEEKSNKTILFFGDSLTAGYGLKTEEAFPALIQDRLDSLGLEYTVINSGVSGETTSGGLNRLDWVLRQEVAIFVLELGANDGLRGVPLAETRKNLQEIINAVKAKSSDTQIVLAGMQIPPNMGPEYTTEFRTIFPELAAQNDIPLIPFLLEGVAGIRELNLEDGIHPTAEGHKIVRENVWKVLEPVLVK